LLVSSCTEHSEAGTTVLPFEFLHDEIIVEFKVNGEGPFLFLLDTGVDPSVVDLNVAEEAGLTVVLENAGEAEGVGMERVLIYPTEITNLRHGNFQFGNVEGLAVDLSKLGERIGIRLGGILGYSFLKNRSVEIDYQAETLTFFEEPSADEPCQDRNETSVCFWVPLESNTEEDMIPALEAFFINGIPVRVSLDTGSSLALTVNPKTMESLGIDYTIDEGKTVIVRGARGEVERQSGVLASVRIGPFQIENVPALFTEENFDVSSPRLGNVGNKILSQFTVTFDYVNSRIVFKKLAGHE